MTAKLDAYRKAQDALPPDYLAWELYGPGFDNLGKEGKPISLPLPAPGPEELLARVDALGLCFSDIKIINLGGEHPRLTGRNLAQDPVVLGHEVAATIVQVGEKLRERFQVGQKLLVQADAHWHGQSLAYGYALRGGAAQYTIFNEVLHSGDEGSYLLPIADSTGYSEAALTEPWACVECSYHIHSRPGPKPHGHTWVIGLGGADQANLSLGEGFDYKGGPKRVLLTDVIGPVAEGVRHHAKTLGFHVEETASLARLLPLLEQKQNESCQRQIRRGEHFDDIILLGAPRPGLVERLSPLLAKGGHFAIICPEPTEQKAEIDLGRIHYDDLHYIGTGSSVVMQAYRGRRTSALREGGAALLIGAGGPMGQMHLQRALEHPHGPRLVAAADVDEARLAFLKSRYEDLAEKHNRHLLVLDGRKLDHEMLRQVSGGEWFADIILFAPVAALAEQAWEYLGEEGVLNIFAGVAKGTKANLSLRQLCQKGCRVVGSSGSGLGDLRFTLAEAEAGRLSPDKVVAAIGGIAALREGLSGVAQGHFPGKVVIYPQLDLPLIPLPELREHLPAVADKLEGGQFWNRDAEAALLETLLP